MVNVCYYGSFSIVQFLTVQYIITFRTEYIRTESKLYRTYDLLSKWLPKHENNTQKGGVCGIKRTRIPLLYGIPSVLSVTVILPSSAPPPAAILPTGRSPSLKINHLTVFPVIVFFPVNHPSPVKCSLWYLFSYKRVVAGILRYRSPTVTATPSLP